MLGRFALASVLGVSFAAGLGGCVRFSTPSSTTHALAPLDVVPEVSRGATLYRLFQGRWPTTTEELETGLRSGGIEPTFLQRTTAFSVQEVSSRSILYHLRFAGGGFSEVRINLNPTQEPAG
ncbi:MAG TPA: hypothetical protein PLN52_01275, partial [Opitutaceae bacterium]|nr:hypothetical protein [Opitutaceae bacterium]